jgi:hypothetical protein
MLREYLWRQETRGEIPVKGIGSEVNNDFHTKIHSFRPYLRLIIAAFIFRAFTDWVCV